MSLGTILVERGDITTEQLGAARQRQKVVGGFLFENLLALGSISSEALDEVIAAPPDLPRTIEETGLEEQFLLDFIIKSIYVSAEETIAGISRQTCLSKPVVEHLLTLLRDRGLVEIAGTAQSQYLMRYILTGNGTSRALDALSHSAYVGPAPVTLEDFQSRVEMQSIVNERVDLTGLKRAMKDLVLAPSVMRQLGPAVNSGKALLLYGSSGNGKTSVAERLGNVFEQNVFIPHAIKVDQQIIRVFDAAIHHLAQEETSESGDQDEPTLELSLSSDPRWECCRRPVVVAGGELTLGMLDLDFDAVAKFYEAPLQVKAMGGVLVIDDFGRQLVKPEDLLNRWIVPLERKVDYLSLHTGKKFEVPFDAIVVFSTNLDPAELMDAAFLRRINYKVRLDAPSLEEFSEIFRRFCALHDLKFSPEIVSHLVKNFYQKFGVPLAAVHPKLIVEHSLAAAKFYGWDARLTDELIDEAVENLAERIRVGVNDAVPGKPDGEVATTRSNPAA